MNLEEVDVGGTQALERSFDGLEDCGARKACGFRQSSATEESK